MGFEPIDKGGGVSRADCVCDGCGRRETVPADYERQGAGAWALREGPLHRKMEGRGWSLVKKSLLCPKCTAQRKVVALSEKKPPAPEGPSRRQKLEIIDLLKEVYDAEAERYCGGDTDDTVASVLGVPPAWVAELREDLFGPAGNEEIEALRIELEAFLAQSADQIARAAAACEALEALRGKARGYLDRLTAIEGAIGARNRKKIGAR